MTTDLASFYESEREKLREWAADTSRPLLAAYSRILIRAAQRDLAAAGGR